MKTCKIFIILLLLLPVPFSHARAEGRIYRVAGSSMTPTLLPGDPVVVTDVKNLERGNLVAIGFQQAAHPMVKRVIAVAGDRVEIVEGNLRVNDERVRKIDPGKWVITMKQLSRYGGRLPAGTLLVLGDNPENSRDSRRFGLVAVHQVAGKVFPLKGRPRYGEMEGSSIEGSSMR